MEGILWSQFRERQTERSLLAGHLQGEAFTKNLLETTGATLILAEVSDFPKRVTLKCNNSVAN